MCHGNGTDFFRQSRINAVLPPQVRHIPRPHIANAIKDINPIEDLVSYFSADQSTIFTATS